MKKILVADDEQDQVRVTCLFLKSAGFETIEANDGLRAIEKAKKMKPDLILLDLNMPAGSGQTVLKVLRSNAETMKIPIIVLTGSYGLSMEDTVKEAGAQDFLLKPFDNTTLLTKILRLISL